MQLAYLTKLQASLLLVCCAALSSCEDCSEPKKVYGRGLTEAEKAISPYQENEVVQFKDASGGMHLFTVSRKTYSKGVARTDDDRKDPCEESIYYNNVLETVVDGAILASGCTLSGFTVSVSSSPTEADYYTTKFTIPGKSFFYLQFHQTAPARSQTFYGLLEPDGREILNFNYAPQLSINGVLHEHVNYKKMGEHTIDNSITSNTPVVGMDSVYYNHQHGLLRFTTVEGDYFQRAL